MKRFMWAWMWVTATLVVTAVVVLAQGVTPVASHSNGNQLMQKSASWYEKPAETVGPVEGSKSKDGTALILQPGSSVYLIGKSTLHDYQMTAHVLKGSAVLKGSSRDPLKALQKGQLKALTFVVPVNSFKSRESGLDDNADKALQSKEYPNIQFKSTGESLRSGTTEGSYVMTVPGLLTVAGVSVPVTLSGTAVFTKDQVRFRGVQKLKFTDFQIKPPAATVLIVTITCTDEFEVDYDVLFALSAPEK
jgi:hypothetical protein